MCDTLPWKPGQKKSQEIMSIFPEPGKKSECALLNNQLLGYKGTG